MDTNNVENPLSSILVSDVHRVMKAIEKILKTGKEYIPSLLQLCRDSYEKDFEQIVPVYIPFHAPKSVSWVDNGNYLTPSTLSLYLVESIRTNHEIHARFLLGHSFNIDLVASRNRLSPLLVERILYEMTIEVALRAYERWWEMIKNKEVSFSRGYSPWIWFPPKGDRTLPPFYRQAARFAALDIENLRLTLPHHKVDQEKWETFTVREKTIALGLKSIIYHK